MCEIMSLIWRRDVLARYARLAFPLPASRKFKKGVEDLERKIKGAKNDSKTRKHD